MHLCRKYFLCAVVLSLAALSVRAAEPADMPKAVELDSKEIAAYVVIPHADVFIKSIEALGNKFSPFPMKPGTMRAQVGQGIGDPDLAGFDFSKPLVLMVLKGPPSLPPLPAAPPPVAIFIPVKNAEPYKNALAAIANLQVEVKDNVVVASDKPESVEKAVAQKAAYDKIAAADLKGDARIFVSIAQLTETYGRQIDASLDEAMKTFAMMQMNPAGAAGMDPESLGAIMKIYVKTLAGMLKQSQTAQIDLSFKDDSISQDLVFSAKPGTTLAKFLVEPSPGENKLLPMIKSGGVMSVAGRMNPAAIKEAGDAMLPEIEKDPELKKVFDDKMVALMKEALPLFGGEMVLSMVQADKGFPQTRSVMTITDAKKYVELMDRVMEMIGPDSTLGKLYANMGIAMKFEKNVREHAGVQIHKLKFTMDEKKLQPAQAAQMKMMMHDTELAIFNTSYVTATDAAELDTMIDQLKAGIAPKPGDAPPLKAMTTYGAKQQFYVDYDFLALMKSTMSADPNNPMAAVFKDIKGGDPIQFAGVMADGKFLMHTFAPLAPFIQMTKAMQQLMGPGIKPPPPPPDKPGQF
jgi:hypothetical protein